MISTKRLPRTAIVAFWSLAILAIPARADTVYLKNGAWIDGHVRARNDKIVEVEIGRIGKMEISAEEIYEIEKNNRTGDEDRGRPPGDDAGLLKFTREGKTLETEDAAAPADGAVEAGESGAPSPAEDPPKIDPELKARIEALVEDLDRQKPQFRVRAERHLKAIGEPAVPFLLPLARSSAELTRIAVFRLFSDIADESAIEACIAALLDTNEYVRDFANRTLERVTHESFGFNAQSSPIRREQAHEKWKKWWEQEESDLDAIKALSRRNGGAGS